MANFIFRDASTATVLDEISFTLGCNRYELSVPRQQSRARVQLDQCVVCCRELCLSLPTPVVITGTPANLSGVAQKAESAKVGGVPAIY